MTAPAFAIHGLDPGEATPHDLGGKARGLELIVAVGLRTAPWFGIPASDRPPAGAPVPVALAGRVADACIRLTRDGAAGFAVRSSALDEDGATRSFAGQHLTVLNVTDVPGVLEAVRRCWDSADSPSARAYRTAVGLPAVSPGMAVIVQVMVDARTSGVAFSAAPDGAPASSGNVMVAATRGLGAPLVGGAVNGDEYRVGPDGAVVVHRTDPGAPSLVPQPGGGVALTEPSTPPDHSPRCLDDDEVRAIADAARLLERTEGTPQDVEWAITPEGHLVVLQTRPITVGGTRPGGAPTTPGDRVRVWDNANIVESFSGVTLPLTYSVAREAYTTVYRGACRALGVGESTIDANADVFDQMIGHLDGRVYYNVSSWHRVLALLPGFGANQAFLERMMGAARPGGRAGERAEAVGPAGGLRGLATVAWRSGQGLVLFERRARAFERMIRELRRESRRQDVDSMSIEALLEAYDQVRRRALARWHVTIFNDLAVMVVHGALRRATEAWLSADGAPIVNRLLRTGRLASTEPASELRAIARRLRDEPEWRHALDAGGDPVAALRSEAALADLCRLVDGYLERWGDRCPSELQLDRPTFREEPAPLLAVIRALVSAGEPAALGAEEADRAAAWYELDGTLLPTSALVRQARLLVLHRLVEMTRYRLAWRERMRFARTEVFAIGRGIFRAMDRRFTEAGLLDGPGDLHYLDIVEIRGAVRGTIPPVDLRLLARERRARFARFLADDDPPSRFETTGPVMLARHQPQTTSAGGGRARELSGIPVSAGIVRGACLPVHDPRAVTPGPTEIVAARSTDPGWVPILVASAGLLVERGSLLSHSAIVARELRLPTIVGIDGLMVAVDTGSLVEMDGSTGRVRIEPAPLGPAVVAEAG